MLLAKVVAETLCDVSCALAFVLGSPLAASHGLAIASWQSMNVGAPID
jgi:hypothetical protein